MKNMEFNSFTRFNHKNALYIKFETKTNKTQKKENNNKNN